MKDAVLADFMDDFASSDAAVFQSACQRMVNNMAVAPAAEIAYGYLKKEISPLADTERAVLKQIGRLNSFYCDTPLNMGLILHDSTNSFGLNMSNGILMTSDTASEMLYAFGESTSTREKARAFVSEMDTAPASLLKAPTNSQLSTIFEGALDDSFASTSYEINGDKAIGLLHGGVPLSKFLYALASK